MRSKLITEVYSHKKDENMVCRRWALTDAVLWLNMKSPSNYITHILITINSLIILHRAYHIMTPFSLACSNFSFH